MILKSGRLAVVGAGVVLLFAGFAGCGGDDDSGPLSKDEYVAQVNQICADFEEESSLTEKAFTAALEENDLEAAADAFDENANAMSDSIDEVEALEAPEGDEATIEEFVSLSRAQNDAAIAAAEALRADDEAAFQEASNAGVEADNEADAIASEYGLTDCLGDSEQDA